ncbi:MAG: hypothetical protein JWR72_2268 [Flavisolibacter sp.]|nr:hypothetical protein [Flavisolibacter sp.]
MQWAIKNPDSNSSGFLNYSHLQRILLLLTAYSFAYCQLLMFYRSHGRGFTFLSSIIR